MAFFVYLFVLLVAAGSVIFGLDLTQSPLRPPAYATAPAQTTTNTPPVSTPTRTASVAAAAPVRAKSAASASSAPAPVSKTAEAARNTPAEASAVDARAEASVQEAQAKPPVADASVSAPNHCAIDACAAAYHSFRASDCTYQPFEGGRRLCTKTASSKRVAAARPVVHRVARGNARRAYDRTYAERDDNRDSYSASRRGWGFDLFGDAFGR